MTRERKTCYKCAAPVIKYKTGSGHKETCPVHLEWLEAQHIALAQAAPQPAPSPPAAPRKLRWGDHIERALTAIGITKERVEKWYGAPCGCPERREKLNKLEEWTKRVLFGEKPVTTDHAEDLEAIITKKK